MAKQIFVGNLSYNTTSQSLQIAFEKYGEITAITIPKDRDSGRVRGFAFITFDTPQAAELALAMNDKELDGRKIRVNVATEKKY